MAKNRLEYALILLCTALFYICFVGYLSFYVFMLTLILPLFSLLCSLPAMLGVRAELLRLDPEKLPESLSGFML